MPKEISRHDFLKYSAAIAAVSAAEALLASCGNNRKEPTETTFREFAGIHKRNAEILKTCYRIILLSPTTWLGESNLEWDPFQLNEIVKTVTEMPTELLPEKPHSILLLKKPGTDFLDVKYTNQKDKIELEIAENFDLDESALEVSDGLFPQEKTLLKTLIIFHFALEFVKRHPEIVKDFQKYFPETDKLLPSSFQAKNSLETLSWTIALNLSHIRNIHPQITNFFDKHPLSAYRSGMKEAGGYCGQPDRHGPPGSDNPSVYDYRFPSNRY